ncbi:ABC transporter ATP-binding protein [Prauserella rugosa]|uniref:Putative ABC transport system ATP-binding protein n=1 Tax=Prauserella rugosa TaxID=43354 RepID=A0A660C6P3_9PSEU|nr:ATP-binding cassette domain-containing protein [Prauserella rugosa]KMS89563.1 ABC transporter ATP-binding protein [Streptomyces regensis]TWH19270.1 putative ABC transport system ATP-binding protein [Prauserella rugosa]
MTPGEHAPVGPATLRAAGLRRVFPHPGGDVEVLRGVDLTVEPGEFVTLAGRSGSGKSALVAVLCGFDRPDSGTVHIGGDRVTQDLPWRTCAVVPQSLGLTPELTAAENVALPLVLGGVPASEAAATAEALLSRVQLGAVADRRPGELSFGQQQRVALARAVSPRPAVLIADEPTAHLDTGTTPVVLDMLRDHAVGGGAVLVATHDDAVHQVADRRIDLSDGVLELSAANRSTTSPR